MFRILVVDDDKNVRYVMRELLELENYTVFTAENGERALELMLDTHVDLVIVDIMMPKMDGYEFTKELRGFNPELPVLMVSAKQLPEDITEFQVLFTLGRAALNFIDLCGVHKAYYDGKDTDDMLLRQIGFTKNADGEYFIDLEGFFTSPCKCQSK